MRPIWNWCCAPGFHWLPSTAICERRHRLRAWRLWKKVSTKGLAVIRQGFDNACGFDADAHHLAGQAHDIAGIVLAVGVALALHLILVDDPFQCRARAEAVVERLWRNAGEGEGVVDLKRLLIGAELHFDDAL